MGGEVGTSVGAMVGEVVRTSVPAVCKENGISSSSQAVVSGGTKRTSPVQVSTQPKKVPSADVSISPIIKVGFLQVDPLLPLLPLLLLPLTAVVPFPFPRRSSRRDETTAVLWRTKVRTKLTKRIVSCGTLKSQSLERPIFGKLWHQEHTQPCKRNHIGDLEIFLQRKLLGLIWRENIPLYPLFGRFNTGQCWETMTLRDYLMVCECERTYFQSDRSCMKMAMYSTHRQKALQG